MARIAGRNARLYLAIASNGSAEPIASISKFTLSGATERFDATCFGDTTKTYVSGLPDSSGSFSGIYDTSVNATFTAAQDGIARKFYFYPDTVGAVTAYYFGTGFFDFSADFDVAGLAGVSGNFSAATPTIKV